MQLYKFDKVEFKRDVNENVKRLYRKTVEIGRAHV